MKYILGVLGLIILAIFAIALIGRGGSQTQLGGKPVVSLLDYANSGATISHTTKGRIVGDDTHKSIRIAVNKNERKVEVVSGYQGLIEKSQSFANNPEAFKIFIHALSTAGYTRERVTDLKDELGICPQGNRFIYELRDETGKEVTRLWSTNCSGRQGNFGGSSGVIRRLFQDQITDYSRVVTGVRL